MRKAEAALASYIQQSLGASAVSKELSVAIGGMALGGGAVGGALLGVGALVAAYDKLTESSRKLQAEQKRLVDALGAQFAPKTGPRSQTNKEFEAALHERADLTRQIMVLEEKGQFFPGQIAGLRKELADVQQKIDDAYAGSITKMETVKVEGVKGAKEMTFGFNELRDAAERVNAELLKDKRDWWVNYIEATGRAKNITEEFIEEARRAQPEMFDIIKGMIMPDLSVMMPKVSVNDSVSKAQIKAAERMGILIDRGDQNSQAIRNTILQSANIITSALNIGGGGRGSGIGGALGSVLGAGLTVGAGVLTSGLWGIAGGLIGSAVGGLFDHKKAVEQNTAATRENSAIMAQLMNAPSVYKVARDRFDATQVRDFRRASVRYATRGGAPILVTP